MYTQKDFYKKGHSSIIYNKPKQNKIQMFFDRGMGKKIIAYL